MSNLKNLKTKHYISKILKTKKLKINNKTYIGFNINDYEANGTYVSGVVVNQLPTNPSNWRSESSFSDFLIKNKITCIANIDTRYLTSI